MEDSNSQPFRSEEFAAAFRCLKPGKSPGLDSILLEFILHARSALKSCLCDFLTSCMHQLKIAKIWRRALVVAILSASQRSHWRTQRAIVLYLCCASFLKILERLIYTRVETIINPLPPQEQAGFRHRRSDIDQVTLLTQDIEDSFSAKKKAGAVSVHLTTAYDTVWHCGLICKLLRLLPDRHVVHVIMETVGNRSFTKGADYDASRTVSHRDLLWRPLFSTSTSLTCQLPSPERMHVLTT